MLYLVWKPQVSSRMARWLLLFLEYDFSIIYKPGRSHFVANALVQMLNVIKESGIPNQIMDVTIFLLQSMWLQEIILYLTCGKISIHYN
jgi:hypothetical protein